CEYPSETYGSGMSSREEAGVMVMEIFQRARKIDVCRAGGELAGSARDAMLLDCECQVHLEWLRAVIFVLHVHRRRRERAAIARRGTLVRKIDADIFAAQRERLRAVFLNFDHSAIHHQPSDRRVQQPLSGVLLAAHLRVRNVRRTIRSDDQIDVRLRDFEATNIDIAVRNRGDLDAERDARRSQEGRLSRGFSTVYHQIANFRTQFAPIEVESADLDTPTGGGLDRGDEFHTYLVVKPVALYDKENRNGGQQQEHHKPARGP